MEGTDLRNLTTVLMNCKSANIIFNERVFLFTLSIVFPTDYSTEITHGDTPGTRRYYSGQVCVKLQTQVQSLSLTLLVRWVGSLTRLERNSLV